MARLIISTKDSPYEHVLPSGEKVHICMCGLSGKYPLCNGSHLKARDEDKDKIYIYNEKSEKLVAKTHEELGIPHNIKKI
jgi:CDGSH-type Zn-finger protein